MSQTSNPVSEPVIYKAFKKVLVANRGEIAVRILKACRERGLATVAVYSDADREAPHVLLADEAVHIGAATSRESYLNMDVLLQAAGRTGADAIHPGYGFLAENAGFAARVIESGLVWIGPSPKAIEEMGSKTRARALAESLGVPVIPGWQGVTDDISLIDAAEQIGYPLLLKAVAGGGGRGMRRVERAEDLQAAITSARREAEQAFGDGSVYLEKYLPEVRHIEFQILGDAHGQLIHVFERECSLQRRYQKIIEESPSPSLTPELREQMGEAAVRLGQALNYCGAGTVEFVLAGQAFYFLEVNTRLQVEHPVTEQVTGLDLAHWQLRLAAGEVLTLNQSELKQQGHAIECRICAEDPEQDFRPCSGEILSWQQAEGPGIRYDGGVGSRVPVDYDSMLAKLIVTAETRAEAIQRLEYALLRTVLLGTRSNLDFLQKLVAHPVFASAEFHTRWIEAQLESAPTELLTQTTLLQRHEAVIVTALSAWNNRDQQRGRWSGIPSGWRNNAFAPQQASYRIAEQTLTLSYRAEGQQFNVQVEDTHYRVLLVAASETSLSLEIDGLLRTYTLARSGSTVWLHHPSLGTLSVDMLPRFPEREDEAAHGGYTASMPAKILQILVEPGQTVSEGTPLLVMESMKMETTLCAAESGVVEQILVNQGEVVEAGTSLLVIQTEVSLSTQ